LALHALEVMLAFEQSSIDGKHIDLNPTIDRPAPMGENEFADEVSA